MKMQSVRRLKKLQKQFPVIAMQEEMHGRFPQDKPVTLRIFVERADPELLYRKADNVDGERSYCCKENGHRGSRKEKACGVTIRPDGKHEIVFRKIWDESNSRKHVRDCFGSEKIDYILWITTYTWYKPATEKQERLGIRLGEHIETERIYTVYLAPKDGDFTKLRETTDLCKNVRLSTRMLMSGIIEHNTEFEQANAMLTTLASTFETLVYLRGLKELVRKSKQRGMCGTFDGVNVMSWVMAGRIMVTLEAPNLVNPKIKDTFTVIGCDSSEYPANFGYQSVCATMKRAAEMMDKVVIAWSTLSPDQKAARFLDNDSVTLDILAGRKKG